MGVGRVDVAASPLEAVAGPVVACEPISPAAWTGVPLQAPPVMSRDHSSILLAVGGEPQDWGPDLRLARRADEAGGARG
jgi:hypothetical protein